jgi:hypothetical protein
MRKSILALAALVTVLAAGVPGPAQAAAATTVSLRLTQDDGSPVVNAVVGVFYLQPADSDKPSGTRIPLAELGSGTTNSNGAFSTTLRISVVKKADLGDAGDGKADAFNVTLLAFDQAGRQVIVDEIARMNSSVSEAAAVRLQSSSAGWAAHPSVRFPSTTITGPTKYRYTPVTPLNSGAGMQAVLKYTTSSSVQKQTQVDSALLSTSAGGGGWQVGQMQLEEKDRTVAAPYKVHGTFHRWLWARYAYVEYIYRLDHEWKVNHFTGALTVSNPDHIKHSKKKKIGVVNYAVPKFTPGPGGAYYFVLTPAKSGWMRSTGNREANELSGTFFIPFGGSVNLADLTTYASVTSVTYNYVRGCPKGSKRVLWGHGVDPGAARRIQANCFPDRMLR